MRARHAKKSFGRYIGYTPDLPQVESNLDEPPHKDLAGAVEYIEV